MDQMPKRSRRLETTDEQGPSQEKRSKPVASDLNDTFARYRAEGWSDAEIEIAICGQ